MKRLLLLGVAVYLVLPQAYAGDILNEDGSDISEWVVGGSAATWASVDGAIVRTSPQAGDATHALVLLNALDLTRVLTPVTLSYDVKAQFRSGGNGVSGEIWTGVGLCAPDDGGEADAIIFALRDDDGPAGLMSLVGGRCWDLTPANIDWQADTWYTITATLDNPDFAIGKIDVDTRIEQKGGGASAALVVPQSPSCNTYNLEQTAVCLYTRGSAADVGGLRSFDNITITAAGMKSGMGASAWELYD